MTYVINDLIFETRDEALIKLVAQYIDANGKNTLEEIKAAVYDKDGTATEMVEDLGDEWGHISIGYGEAPADKEEIYTVLHTRASDVIIETSPSDADVYH